MDMFLLSSLSNMIIDSVSRWIGGWLVSRQVVGVRLLERSVVGRFNKTHEETC